MVEVALREAAEALADARQPEVLRRVLGFTGWHPRRVRFIDHHDGCDIRRVLATYTRLSVEYKRRTRGNRSREWLRRVYEPYTTCQLGEVLQKFREGLETTRCTCTINQEE